MATPNPECDPALCADLLFQIVGHGYFPSIGEPERLEVAPFNGWTAYLRRGTNHTQGKGSTKAEAVCAAVVEWRSQRGVRAPLSPQEDAHITALTKKILGDP